MHVNKKHKASVFSTLFSDPEVLRELYSAIEGIDVPPEAVININTLTGILYMGKLNDVSFTINDQIIVLIEHQSTINNNIPVRMLMYIGRLLEKIIKGKNIYHEKLIKIPSPEFIVLYNGTYNYPDYKELFLSDAFKNIKAAEPTKSLELKVRIYNINHGRNINIQKKSRTLGSYSFFTNKIREYGIKLPLEEAVKNAIKYCIDNDILKQFLSKHGSEVMNMLTDEVSIEEIIEIRSQEKYEEGLEQGREQGREEIRKEKLLIARALLSEGSSPEFIKRITGIEIETL